ncbi:hypothetical protein HK099_001546 [Clydaea vesicula]|uniref:Alpha/beta hydrolase fold-3 domain-containing protein n=1 Tax=Clydaea vesicula TaxID=447962 RepID=A0AAD5TYC7_9FUNG|nr:hypothetical protein HK099_001546 [Clydaea vesicula]
MDAHLGETYGKTKPTWRPAPLPLGVKCRTKLMPRRKETNFSDIEDSYFNKKIEGDWITIYSSNSTLNKIPPSNVIILYLHGGGYFTCSRKSHRLITGTICKSTKATVFAPSYSRAPENTFPLPLIDAISCYLNLIDPVNENDVKYDPKNIVVMGDSAGGGMACALLLWLRENPQYPMPAGVVGISPWLDMLLTFPSFVLNRSFDYLTGLVGDEFTERDPKHLNANRTHYYCKNDSELSNYLVSPIYAKHNKSDKNLPPILIQVGTAELFRDECIAFYEKTLPNATIQLELYENMVHVWCLFPSQIEPLSGISLENISHFVKKVTNPDIVLERSCTEIRKTKGNLFKSDKLLNPYKIVEEGRKEIQALHQLGKFNYINSFPTLPEGLVVGCTGCNECTIAVTN